MEFSNINAYIFLLFLNNLFSKFEFPGLSELENFNYLRFICNYLNSLINHRNNYAWLQIYVIH